jgi:hypothetical protein
LKTRFKSEGLKMKLGLLVLSVLATLAGLTWMGQGSGYFPYPASSFMISQTPWIWRGAVVAVLGVVGVVLSRRM